MQTHIDENHKRLPITSTDIFLFCFILVFVAVGIYGTNLLMSSGAMQESPMWVIWSIMFIGMPWVFVVPMVKRVSKFRKASRFGNAIEAKVLDYVDDSSMRVNGRPVKDLLVGYFDEAGRMCRVNVDANTLQLRSFLVGSTVLIYECDGEYVLASKGYDKHLPREEEFFTSSPVLDTNYDVAGQEQVRGFAQSSVVQDVLPSVTYKNDSIPQTHISTNPSLNGQMPTKVQSNAVALVLMGVAWIIALVSMLVFTNLLKDASDIHIATAHIQHNGADVLALAYISSLCAIAYFVSFGVACLSCRVCSTSGDKSLRNRMLILTVALIVVVVALLPIGHLVVPGEISQVSLLNLLQVVFAQI